ncbi:MAG TPA: 4'-phosphopantetheinyl transferase superfamily protein [Steroidobacteraceae bacterium]|nr:4'-phosphopantetheinyl transferase superfamily protein [Steroidobacteraceae bacterium]
MAKETRGKVPSNSQFEPLPGRAPDGGVPNPAALSGAIAALFPDGVVAAELSLPGDASLLYPEEAVSVARAVPKRVQEFAAGRLCARRALAELGVAGFALRVADDRAPLWPPAVVGSISHAAGLCAAVTAEKRHFASLGLDLERWEELKRELWPRVCRPAELEWLESLPAAAQAVAATLIFSAKEAFYKCQYPLTGERLGFADVSVEPAGFDARDGATGNVVIEAVRALAMSSGPRIEFQGRYRVRTGYVCVGFCVPGPLPLLSTPYRRETPSRP